MGRVAEWFGFAEPTSGRLEASQMPELSQQAGRTGIRTPWSTTNLAPIVWEDLFGLRGVDAPVGRAQALSVPAVVKGVALITSALSACRLVMHQGTDQVTEPGWRTPRRAPSPPSTASASSSRT